jgi:hypothetical protein
MTTAKASSRPRRSLPPHDGRDEMNLVEFPFATLSERSGDTKVLEFQTDAYDRVIGKPVTRKLTVTGDAKHGLPTAKDEEVYLALLQLTKLHNDFSHARVYFTRAELIKLMGWKNRDWSYHRVATAFCRLTGVRLFYEHAWRDNTKKRFCSQGGFGLLDSFLIRDGRIRSADGDETDRLSEFCWNSVIFDSFQSGYLKKLDYAKVRELGAIARRIYRYLDKHFHPPLRTTLTLNLKSFACEHIGVSRNNDAAQIRRTLAKPIQELESIGFLQPMPKRFRKVQGQRGVWEVVFSLAGHPEKRKPARACDRPPNPMIVPLVSRKPDKLDRYLATLPETKRKEIEAEAMQSASGFLLETLQSQEDGPLADECRNQIMKAYLSTKLTQRSF